MTDHTMSPMRRARARDRFEYRALVALMFLPCLVVSGAARASGAASHGETLISAALSSARVAAGYAYLA